MNCGIIEDKILDYVDGELSNDEEKRIKNIWITVSNVKIYIKNLYQV